MPERMQPSASNYICPKCRGKKPHVREVVIHKGRLIHWLNIRLPFFSPPQDTRYLEVTCSLCGYTEFYNLALYAAQTETDEEAAKNALPERPKGA